MCNSSVCPATSTRLSFATLTLVSDSLNLILFDFANFSEIIVAVAAVSNVNTVGIPFRYPFTFNKLVSIDLLLFACILIE